MNDDDPITLKEACEIVFRNTCGVETLRAEAARGNLAIARVGKRYYTTIRDARELLEKCRVEPQGRAYISIPSEERGQSATERIASARAALRKNLNAHKGS